MTSDPIRFNAATYASTLPDPMLDKADPLIRFTGGRMIISGAGYPMDLFNHHYDTTYNDGPGFSGRSGTGSFELFGVVDSFEWYFLDSGGGYVEVTIDGVATNAAGYPENIANNGDGRYRRVDLPSSAAQRRIRVHQEAPFGGLRVDAAAVLSSPNVPTSASAVWIGDSITEGSGATREWLRWAEQAAARLGIDNPIVSGVGGSGYIRFIADRNPGYPDHTFGQRTGDVLQAVNGGPPDLAVIAGGINDSGLDPAAVEAAALSYFRALRAGAPNMAIVALGPFCDYTGYNAGLIGTRDAIFRAAAKVDRVSTVDTAGWVTAANRDVVFNGTVNGPHPVDAGHALYGQLAAEAIAPIIRGL